MLLIIDFKYIKYCFYMDAIDRFIEQTSEREILFLHGFLFDNEDFYTSKRFTKRSKVSEKLRKIKKLNNLSSEDIVSRYEGYFSDYLLSESDIEKFINVKSTAYLIKFLLKFSFHEGCDYLDFNFYVGRDFNRDLVSWIDTLRYKNLISELIYIDDNSSKKTTLNLLRQLDLTINQYNNYDPLDDMLKLEWNIFSENFKEKININGYIYPNVNVKLNHLKMVVKSISDCYKKTDFIKMKKWINESTKNRIDWIIDEINRLDFNCPIKVCDNLANANDDDKANLALSSLVYLDFFCSYEQSPKNRNGKKIDSAVIQGKWNSKVHNERKKKA